MGMLQQLEKWSTTHHPRWLVLFRVALGVGLILKGVSFISNSVDLELMMAETNYISGIAWLSFFITWLHLICGLLLIVGFLTRWASLIMIPILLGAVIFVNAPKGIFTAESELGFSLVVLLMLIVFFIEGGGPVSMDRYLKKPNSATKPGSAT